MRGAYLRGKPDLANSASFQLSILKSWDRARVTADTTVQVDTAEHDYDLASTSGLRSVSLSDYSVSVHCRLYSDRQRHSGHGCRLFAVGRRPVTVD
eukprot:2256565-Prymnesium_polylepis.1